MIDHDLSPLMRQYREIKRGYPQAILFFRVGDFYEMFFEDAQIASRLLSIALTSRDKQSPDAIPLCGVPHHAATGYIAKLLKAGKTVLIAAHGNSLRALVMAIEGLTPDEILAREIGTGEPTVYKIGPDGKLVERVTL